mgnify:CR=1 FL=1
MSGASDIHPPFINESINDFLKLTSADDGTVLQQKDKL